MAVGTVLGALGAINLMEGYGNNNPRTKSQGIKQLMVKKTEWYKQISKTKALKLRLQAMKY